jgi:membrane protein
MPGEAPTIYVTERGRIGLALWFFRRAWVAAYEDNCFGVAKGAAFSALLSLFPVLTTTTAILVQAKAPAVSRVLARWISEAVPPGSEDLLRNYLVFHGERPVTLLVAATVLSIWAASGVMLSLMEGFRAAYRIPSARPFLKQRAIAAALVVCAAVPVVAASVLMLFGNRAEAAVIYWLGVVPQGSQLKWSVAIVGKAGRYLFAFGGIVIGAAMLYKIGPNERVRVVWPGAFAATFLWLLGILAFGWYVRHIANYNVLYGSVGAVMALLVWMYVLSIIALFGCELNAQLDHWRSLRVRRVRVQI